MNAQDETRADLVSRIELIETMMQEGRRRIEYWGWSQVLWGAAYLVALGWSRWSHRPDIAWPVTMIAATVIMIVIGSQKKRGHPSTAISRSLGAIWAGVGTGLFIFCFSLAVSGHGEPHAYIAAIETLLGVANFSSAMVLRWRVQFLVAGIWWVSAIATCFVRVGLVLPIFLAALLIGMIGFGLYLMYSQRRDRRASVQHG